MRTNRKPLKVGNLMLVVLTFAVSLKLGMSYSRSARYWEEARLHDNRGRGADQWASLYASDTNLGPYGHTRAIAGKRMSTADPHILGEDRQRLIQKCRSFATYSYRLRDRYRRATFLPWLLDAPDLSSP